MASRFGARRVWLRCMAIRGGRHGGGEEQHGLGRTGLSRTGPGPGEPPVLSSTMSGVEMVLIDARDAGDGGGTPCTHGAHSTLANSPRRPGSTMPHLCARRSASHCLAQSPYPTLTPRPQLLECSWQALPISHWSVAICQAVWSAGGSVRGVSSSGGGNLA